MYHSSDDALLIRGRIYTTFAPAPVWTDALLVRHGRVCALGVDALSLAAYGHPRIWDLAAGTCLVPGFWDSHIHLTDFGFSLDEVALGDAHDARAVVDRLHEALSDARYADDQPLIGRGWMFGGWQGPRPHRDLLESLGARPILLWNHDFHTVWANREALSRCGIDADTSDPPDGRVERDPDGRPTGLLLDGATRLLSRLWPQRTPERIERAIMRAQDALLGLGVTVVCAMGEEPAALRVLTSLRSRAALALRVGVYLPLRVANAAVEAGFGSDLGDDRLWLAGVKAFVDGSLGSQTAWMDRPYDEVGGTGIAMPIAHTLQDSVAALRASGMRLSLHAIGDEAVRRTVAAAKAGVPARGLDRVEHAQLVPPDALAAWPGERLAASVQPGHLTDDVELMQRFWGSARADGAFAFRSLLDRGVPLLFGSDAPVSDPDPIKGVRVAVERRRPGGPVMQAAQRLSVGEALIAYTASPAIAEGRPHLGRLAVASPFHASVLTGDPLSPGVDLQRLKAVAVDTRAKAPDPSC